MWRNLLFIFAIIVIKLNGAFELQTLNSEIIATGGITSITLFGNNPAISDNNYKFLVASNYTNLFGIKDLHCWDFGALYNFSQANSVYLKSNSVGNDIYQENTYQLGYARHLEIPISVGISVSLFDLSIVTFKTERAIGLNFGICYYLNENIFVSSLYGNVNRPKICDSKEELPQYYAMGINWTIIPRIEVKAELFKDTIYPFNSRFGTKIKLHRNINFFTGLQTNPDRFSSGLSIALFNVKFTSAIQTHLKLPETYYFGCQFFIK